MNTLIWSNLLLGAGFLATRATWMLDFVVVAMAIVLVVLAISVFQARAGRRRLHKIIQIVTATILVSTLVAFEIDMQLITDWRELAKPSPLYESGIVNMCLYIHLLFAIPTPFVWAGIIWFALSRFKRSFSADKFNRTHRIWGWIGTVLMFMTAITGWIFYYTAFVA